ncbi:MAG: cobaltochelatase subunit CobN [Pseudomonadota bacterium]
MHVLAAQAGRVDDGDEPVDLGQTPGDIVILSAADSELSAFNAAVRTAEFSGERTPRFRLANLLQLKHPYSIDLYADSVLSHAKLIAIRLIGGHSYFKYGLERIGALCAANKIELIVVPGEATWDANLAGLSSVLQPISRRFWQLCIEGGPENRSASIQLLADLTHHQAFKPEAYAPVEVPKTCWCDPETLFPQSTVPEPSSVPVVFYASLLQSGTVAPIQKLAAALREKGLNPAPLAVPSLKDDDAQRLIEQDFDAIKPPVVINTTAFASAKGAEASAAPILSRTGAPVIQAVQSGSSTEAWTENSRGLSGTDLVMNVAMPELDGRIHGPAISFKQQSERDPLTEFAPVAYAPHDPGIGAIAALAKRGARLCALENQNKRVGIVLANYPTRASRVGNGVGLDTPQSVVDFLKVMSKTGYAVDAAPQTSAALMDKLLTGQPTHRMSLKDYSRFFGSLSPTLQGQITERWGSPSKDPAFHSGGFDLPIRAFGKVVVAIQPARGYGLDPQASYHDPDLVPPHSYVAFYAYLQRHVDAVIQFGKHGNLEWLPGKALALSDDCFPAALLGDLPLIYPFIVNDPGEGSQAKRRNAAVVIDHLTPPLTRAEGHGPYLELEALLDEYAMAEASDPQRAKALAEDIIGFATETGLADDVGIKSTDTEALVTLDTALCDLKELQIRDGLHIFGTAPDPDQSVDTLVAMARVPRGSTPEDASLLRALADDLGLAIDPLTRDLGAKLTEPRPAALQGTQSWRKIGDAVEALEALAKDIVAGAKPAPGQRSETVVNWINAVAAERLAQSPSAETANLLAALSGRFVPPGPSGAPSRGRPDVLPTGRNFFSVDVRAVPSPTAWRLGKKSAEALLARHFQDHGEWLQSLVLTCWGTANMRTGGDDIAQALALIGAEPEWDGGAGRVTGFKITPLSQLKRPRVDVTLRISGFFRDAFPHQIDLFDSAVRAIAALDEPADMNPLAARVKADRSELIKAGRSEDDAARMAGFRVFGSMPGSYGAGLQALIDEGGWTRRSDFAEAFIAWGGFAYGAGRQGDREADLLKTRLKSVHAVIQNQDNREHDLLDSDDYYQFEGGLAATVETLSGSAPHSYHIDHSRPEAPHPRTLQEEIGRVVRGRASNPKWIKGVMRHGYKGAFEIAATVDYLFAFAATTHSVTDHHFDALFDAYIADETVRNFIQDANPAALTDILDRFDEALDRGLWSPRRNTTMPLLESLKEIPREAAQ